MVNNHLAIGQCYQLILMDVEDSQEGKSFMEDLVRRLKSTIQNYHMSNDNEKRIEVPYLCNIVNDYPSNFNEFKKVTHLQHKVMQVVKPVSRQVLVQVLIAAKMIS